jgi:hypothetical protein
LHKTIIDLPDIFVCHIRFLKSTEIIMKTRWRILPDWLACGLLSEDAEKINMQSTNKNLKEERRS